MHPRQLCECGRKAYEVCPKCLAFLCMKHNAAVSEHVEKCRDAIVADATAHFTQLETPKLKSAGEMAIMVAIKEKLPYWESCINEALRGVREGDYSFATERFLEAAKASGGCFGKGSRHRKDSLERAIFAAYRAKDHDTAKQILDTHPYLLSADSQHFRYVYNTLQAGLPPCEQKFFLEHTDIFDSHICIINHASMLSFAGNHRIALLQLRTLLAAYLTDDAWLRTLFEYTHYTVSQLYAYDERLPVTTSDSDLHAAMVRPGSADASRALGLFFITASNYFFSYSDRDTRSTSSIVAKMESLRQVLWECLPLLSNQLHHSITFFIIGLYSKVVATLAISISALNESASIRYCDECIAIARTFFSQCSESFIRSLGLRDEVQTQLIGASSTRSMNIVGGPIRSVLKATSDSGKGADRVSPLEGYVIEPVDTPQVSFADCPLGACEAGSQARLRVNDFRLSDVAEGVEESAMRAVSRYDRTNPLTSQVIRLTNAQPEVFSEKKGPLRACSGSSQSAARHRLVVFNELYDSYSVIRTHENLFEQVVIAFDIATSLQRALRCVHHIEQNSAARSRLAASFLAQRILPRNYVLLNSEAEQAKRSNLRNPTLLKNMRASKHLKNSVINISLKKKTNAYMFEDSSAALNAALRFCMNYEQIPPPLGTCDSLNTNPIACRSKSSLRPSSCKKVALVDTAMAASYVESMNKSQGSERSSAAYGAILSGKSVAPVSGLSRNVRRSTIILANDSLTNTFPISDLPGPATPMIKSSFDFLYNSNTTTNTSHVAARQGVRKSRNLTPQVLVVQSPFSNKTVEALVDVATPNRDGSRRDGLTRSFCTAQSQRFDSQGVSDANILRGSKVLRSLATVVLAEHGHSIEALTNSQRILSVRYEGASEHTRDSAAFSDSNDRFSDLNRVMAQSRIVLEDLRRTALEPDTL